MPPSRLGRNGRRLLHRLNQRYRAEFDRAEALHSELEDIRRSRLWRWFARLRSLRRWFTQHLSTTSSLGMASHLLAVPEAHNQSDARVSIIIPFKDDVSLLAACLRSLRRSTPSALEIVLVDNGSHEARTHRFLSRWQGRGEGQLLSRPAPFNFAWLCNEGASVARGEVFLFLNNDTEVLTRTWLGQMLATLAVPTVGVVGATLLYPDQTLQHAGIYPSPAGWFHPYRGQPATYQGQGGELRHVRLVPAVTGACLMVRRSHFEELSGFDERLPVTLNDVDLCQRARAKGWMTAITPKARLLHYESLARGYAVERPSCSTA